MAKTAFLGSSRRHEGWQRERGSVRLGALDSNSAERDKRAGVLQITAGDEVPGGGCRQY